MSNEDYKNKIKKIAENYGGYAQSIQTVEEMAELTQALTKFWRYKGDTQSIINGLKEHVLEELADVKIMLDQIEYLFVGEKPVAKFIEEKTERQLKRISEEL